VVSVLIERVLRSVSSAPSKALEILEQQVANQTILRLEKLTSIHEKVFGLSSEKKNNNNNNSECAFSVDSIESISTAFKLITGWSSPSLFSPF
jgi:hypothetical protein